CVKTHTGPLKSAVKRTAPQQLETHDLIFRHHRCNPTYIKAAPDAKLLRGLNFAILTCMTEVLQYNSATSIAVSASSINM
ncbi:MAG: hypothetical protein WCP85_17225, partial [Mariniphaga sp.]